MMQTTEKSSVVRAQLIPLSDMQMLLPNTCIAEVISLQELSPVENAPQWLLGTMDWRGIQIPVISFEIANDVSSESPGRHARVAVLNGISGDENLPFYGIISQGIPRLLAIGKEGISSLAKPTLKLPLAHQQAEIEDAVAVIPNQEKIEKLLIKECKKIK